jgi:hypothetical protein
MLRGPALMETPGTRMFAIVTQALG